MLKRLYLLAIALCLALSVSTACAQPAPPLPLGAPPVPPGNPLTTAKINLGKALFWEEQLSITGTVACGTCHRPSAAGTDPRTAIHSALSSLASTHPGPDGIFSNADDIKASAGVPAHSADGMYQQSARFRFAAQVGGRKSPSTINSAYSPQVLFWDGRAGPVFTDPITGLVIIQQGGALENQALQPLLDTSEMSYAGAVVNDLPGRLGQVRPLALASAVPAELNAWMNNRDYAALFSDAFGSSGVTPARMALAIASYQRTLNANQTPFDTFNGGTQTALTAQEQRGLGVFRGNDCAVCHAGALLSDNSFRYIGIRPALEDLGRFNQTGNQQNRGQFKVPSLRNVELRAPFMHNGRFNTLEEVVEFYNRGGDFNEPNKDPNVRPRNLSAGQKADLVAFLKRPLTDPRVGPEIAPFDRPSLYTESSYVPLIQGVGIAGTAGIVPNIMAIEPPLLGNRKFTVQVFNGLSNAAATLVVGDNDPGLPNGTTLPNGSYANIASNLNATGDASVQLSLPDGQVHLARTLCGRVYIVDPAAANGFAVTSAFKITLFGASDVLMQAGFE